MSKTDGQIGLKDFLKKHRLRQTELSRVSGVNHGMVNLVCNSIQKPSDDLKKRLGSGLKKLCTSVGIVGFDAGKIKELASK